MNSGIPITQLTAAPFVVTIPTSQWSSGDGDYYITVQATNITQDSILIPAYDHDSESLLNGSVWCVPDIGSFTIHTNKIPRDAVTILVQFSGVLGEAQYQVLADVYSKSQTYSKDQAVAKTEIINNLTSTSTTAPLSANMGKALNEAISQSTAKWTLLASDFIPTEGMEKTVASMSDYDELLICLVSNGWVRQTFTAPLIMIPSAGNSCFPDFSFAESRLYLSINKTSDTKLTFSNLSASGGNTTWANTALRIYIK